MPPPTWSSSAPGSARSSSTPWSTWGPNGVLCLAGLSSGGHSIDVDGGLLNRSLVLANQAIVGSVNANRRHYEAGAAALARADHGWLENVVNRSRAARAFADALDRKPDDVKVVIEINQ